MRTHWPTPGLRFKGLRFGIAVVGEPTGEGSREDTQIECFCDCGRTFTVPVRKLRKRRPLHCGCLRHTSFDDKTGKRYGFLTVERESERHDSRGQIMWECRCDCGVTRTVVASYLTRGAITHCGCKTRERNLEVAERNKTQYGLSHSRIYEIWNGLLKRCENSLSTSYPMYGGRGIKVCEEWRNDILKFMDWALTHGYQDDLTLDRYPDKLGDYSSENCRWATWKQQQRNRTNNILFEWCEQSLTLGEWSEIVGVPDSTLRMRIRNGWSIEQALTLPTYSNRDGSKRKCRT